MSGPAGGMTATEHVAAALGRAERAHARHGRHERRRRHPRRRRAAAHDRVRDRVGPAGRGAADRHQVDRRRRRLDRLGRRGRLPARRAPQRGRRSRGPICYGRGGTRGHGHRREPAARPPRPRVLPRRPDAPRPGAGAAARWRLSASAIGLAPLELAASIVEIANENMASAIKMVSLERGHDPRRFSLLAFGGAGPLHAAAVARTLGIPKVIVPLYPGRLLGARPAARRHPRRQGLDAGVPLERRRRGARQPAVRADHRARARGAPAGGLRGRARDPARDQHALLRPELRARGRDRGRRAGRRGARARVPPLRRAARRALRLRDRARGDRARQLQGDRDREARAARPLARERRGTGVDALRAARCTSAARASLDAERRAPLGARSRARRSRARP